MLWRYRNKPTDRQRKVMAAAWNDDPKKRFVDAFYVSAADTLVARGYITVSPHADGYHVSLTEEARQRRCLPTWRHYPSMK
jgi:hypothetical protein